MQGETILCIAPRDWNSLWRDTQPVMARLAAQNRVLYFEPGRDPEQPVIAELARNLPNFFTIRSQKAQENLLVIQTPSSLPHARRHLPRTVLRFSMPLVIKLNNAIIIRHVRRMMRALGVQAPILWLYGPYQIDLIGKFGEKLTCYYNYDEFADFIDNARVSNLLRRLDNQLSSQVDIVFATSQAQWQRRKAINPNSYFMPNGVDFELFHRPLVSNLPLPPDIANISRPIIGLAGWLGYQIDVKLLRHIAETYVNYSVVLVGPDALPDTEDQQILHALPNVFFLGPKKRVDLPGYLQAFDVALIPYLLSGHGASVYPLKLHEYLAGGRAIVTTALPELQPYNHLVRIGKTNSQFIDYIDEALSDYSPQTIEMRVATARENSWDERVKEISQILERQLSGYRELKP